MAGEAPPLQMKGCEAGNENRISASRNDHPNMTVSNQTECIVCKSPIYQETGSVLVSPVPESVSSSSRLASVKHRMRSAEVLTASFLIMLARCFSTVFSLIFI